MDPLGLPGPMSCNLFMAENVAGCWPFMILEICVWLFASLSLLLRMFLLCLLQTFLSILIFLQPLDVKFNFHVLKFQAEPVVFKMLDEVLQLIIGGVIQRHLVDVVLNVDVELVVSNDVILFQMLDLIDTSFDMLESAKLLEDHLFIPHILSVGFLFF